MESIENVIAETAANAKQLLLDKAGKPKGRLNIARRLP